MGVFYLVTVGNLLFGGVGSIYGGKESLDFGEWIFFGKKFWMGDKIGAIYYSDQYHLKIVVGEKIVL